ncbi:MAG: hypothetical protein WCC84_12050 [Candidatus Cybelea sp.]
MRLLSTALCTTVAVALLAGCSGGTSQMSSGGSSTIPVTPLSRHHHDRPVWASPANYIDNGAVEQPLPYYRRVISSIKNAASYPAKGMYVNEFYGAGTMAYPINNKADSPPFCTVATGSGADVNGIGVDGEGNLITPVAANYSGQHAVDIWQGPGMCGAQVGTFIDPDGQPSDAFSFDALNGTILVSNIFNNSGGAGSVSICTLASGCTGNLTNAAMYKVAGVVMDKSGNCYVSAEDPTGVGTLTYFAGCTGAGQQASGFMNTDYGSLSFDRNGNLVSVDKAGIQLWVYKGCNPACSVIGGPFPLQGETVFGALNKQSMTFMAGDFANGQVDVYLYTPTSLTYFYSYSNGLSVSGKIEGVAYNPAQKTRK